MPCRFECPVEDALLYFSKVTRSMQSKVQGQIPNLKWKWNDVFNANHLQQDLVCMVAWKDGESEIKISFKREYTKGMRDTPKK
jgi:hypothetical protein